MIFEIHNLRFAITITQHPETVQANYSMFHIIVLSAV